MVQYRLDCILWNFDKNDKASLIKPVWLSPILILNNKIIAVKIWFIQNLNEKF